MWAKQLDVGHHVQAASIGFDLRYHFSKFQVDHKIYQSQFKFNLQRDPSQIKIILWWMWAKQLDVGHHVQAASIGFDLRDHFSKFQVDHKI